MRTPIFRLLAVLALLPLTARAQDEGAEPPRKAEPEKDGGGKSLRVTGPFHVTASAEIVKSVIADLESGDQKRVARALEKLKAGPTVLFGAPIAFPGGLQIKIGRGGGESMRGSFVENGKKGTYRLKSDGEGRYELHAELLDDGKVAKTIEDEGTFADLRRKYAFLGAGGMFVTTQAPVASKSSPVPTTTGPVVGVRARPATETLRHHLELPTGSGVVVDAVLPGSRADRIGLKRHDILVRIEGSLVDEPKQVKKLAVGGVELEYVRRGKKHTLTTPESGPVSQPPDRATGKK